MIPSRKETSRYSSRAMEMDSGPSFKEIADEGSRELNEESQGFLAVRKRGDNFRRTWNGSEVQQRRKYLQSCVEAGQLQSGSGRAAPDGWRHKLAGLGAGGAGRYSGKESADSRRGEGPAPARERLVTLVPRPATRTWEVRSHRPDGGADGSGGVIGKSWRKLDPGGGEEEGGTADQEEIQLVKSLGE